MIGNPYSKEFHHAFLIYGCVLRRERSCGVELWMWKRKEMSDLGPPTENAESTLQDSLFSKLLGRLPSAARAQAACHRPNLAPPVHLSLELYNIVANRHHPGFRSYRFVPYLRLISVQFDLLVCAH